MKKVVPTHFPTPLVESIADFGAAVRAARTKAGFSLQDAALMCNVSKQTLQNLELGSKPVRFDTALKLAQLLGVSVFVVSTEKRSITNRILQPILQD